MPAASYEGKHIENWKSAIVFIHSFIERILSEPSMSGTMGEMMVQSQ